MGNMIGKGISRCIRIAIVGAGEFGLQAVHYININRTNGFSVEIAGWFDDTKTKGTVIMGCEVLGGIKDIDTYFREDKFDELFIALGYKHLDFKKHLIEIFKSKIPLANIISTPVSIDYTVKLGCNVMIYPGCIIDKEVIIEDGVTINLGSIVSHNSTVGICSFLAPRVTVAGFSTIGACSFLGIGSTVIDNINICDYVHTGAGAVITEDIMKAGLYLGLPAKLYK